MKFDAYRITVLVPSFDDVIDMAGVIAALAARSNAEHLHAAAIAGGAEREQATELELAVVASAAESVTAGRGVV